MRSKVFPYIALILFTQSGLEAMAESPIYKEIWRGEFLQTSPMPWKGEVEIYIRYSVKNKSTVPFEGIMTWPGIGNTRTKITGIMNETEISFTELKCLSGSCDKLYTGGKYKGIIDQKYERISGESTLNVPGILPISFSGRFQLNRLKSAESD